VADSLKRLGVDHLLTIGGDDTAFAASRLAKALEGLTVAHVPKTIDNDLPLPSDIVTFGFTTACNLGKELVRNLMQDAATTERWFFVTVMGRHAGHLALGIGGSAGATVTVIAEEFPEPQITLDRLVDVLEGAIIKRRAHGREQGVAILSEGLAEKLDPATLGPVERDAYGNVRLAELDLGQMVKERVSRSLKNRGIDVTIVAKDMGYELRCAPPGAHDIQYCRSLGYWATRFLLEGGSNAMVTIQAGRLVPVPFGLMMDAKTGRIRVRYVDVESEMYQTLAAYMIRLKPEDFDSPTTVASLAKAGNLDAAEFTRRFAPVVGAPDRVPSQKYPGSPGIRTVRWSPSMMMRGRIVRTSRSRTRSSASAVSRAPSNSSRFFTVGLRSVISPRRCASTASCGVSHLRSVIS
jgi:6-phosphofructokinase 1